MAQELESDIVLPQLSPRLQAIADMAEPASGRVIDIGTDHAYLPIWLTGAGICSRAIASDLRSGPIMRAKANISKYGFSDKIDARIGDGLEDIVLAEDDTVIIAGMGGLEIIKILDRRSGDIPSGMTLIIQPQRSVYELRYWLSQNEFVIADESIVHDRRHFYTIMKIKYDACQGNNAVIIDETSAWIGPILMEKYQDNAEDPKWINYLKDKRNTLAKAVRGKPELTEILDQIEIMLAKADK